METPTFEEFFRTGDLDAQIDVVGVRAAAGCWRGTWLYACQQGDGPGVVHVMRDAKSGLEAVSKLLTGTLEKI
ncbi:hypothetical protein DZF91_09150 [Actinomadura logoneensis]|uniref:Uncharacterized protein n=1 Tax=Actinomadura logoneensis TaxID=2293572 RepID=A0A372JPQ7_9ACTN|nr:hypothetical protein [Actinomadura logoneensis]RFU41939.1 hypothetical protein DZF91_09150 [Actinomadura logoneensis]